MKTTIKSTRLKIKGRVQGVGFRPFVYRLAKKFELNGWIRNSIGSVEILLQGEEKKIEGFITELLQSPPPLSQIENVERQHVDWGELLDFQILESKVDEGFNFVPPDIAICDDCLRELRDSKDRRFNYPFINCTNCGPRYTIIEDLPYDREKTTMKVFPMCPECEKEYHDPLSRRFHAQPISCYHCGPYLWIEGEGSEETFKKIAKYLEEGKILAIKGIGGFHLACDATNSEAVLELRKRKRRNYKPFALMMKDLEQVEEYCYLGEIERQLLTSRERPIVLLRIKNLKDISPFVAPDNHYLGVMLPYTPYHHLIFDHFSKPLILTSGNFSEEPIVKDNEEAKEELSKIADVLVLHNRDIANRVDDSVVFVEKKSTFFIRRARGYAPDPIKVNIEVSPALALGGELKSTFALGKDHFVFLSPHIGDLKDLETFRVYEETIEKFIRLFRIEPEILVHDLHPLYLSSDFAKKFSSYMEVKALQHHKAHFYSLLLDRGITEDIICFAFDGTGYGEDGKIWGGEVFVGNLNEVKRAAYFKYFPIVGSDYSIENPILIALSYLYRNFDEKLGDSIFTLSELERDLIKESIKRDLNLFYTSSAGRIFDMVSAILGICTKSDYEGHPAISLEMEAMRSQTEEYYPFTLTEEEALKIDLLPAITRILEEKEKIERSVVARKFHNTVAIAILKISEILREKYGVKNVGFTGGVFQNRLLINLIRKLFEGKDFKLYFHRQVPPNDGGISLGQVILARRSV